MVPGLLGRFLACAASHCLLVSVIRCSAGQPAPQQQLAAHLPPALRLRVNIVVVVQYLWGAKVVTAQLCPVTFCSTRPWHAWYSSQSD
ncbi:hypothetical protein COO60DRAFT_615699 [Scenedesmus sp. NREL 46B-D3]|nr:hypothetical protein COO60DRAFT_615699 [Scenedesmus sp. NREL 46B-D3]